MSKIMAWWPLIFILLLLAAWFWRKVEVSNILVFFYVFLSDWEGKVSKKKKIPKKKFLKIYFFVSILGFWRSLMPKNVFRKLKNPLNSQKNEIDFWPKVTPKWVIQPEIRKSEVGFGVFGVGLPYKDEKRILLSFT